MYEKLAVFLDDDPIHSAALEVLWGVERYEVDFKTSSHGFHKKNMGVLVQFRILFVFILIAFCLK